MAIEGIRSAVGSSYASRNTQPSADITVGASGGAQVKVENAIPKSENKGTGYSEQDKKQKEENASVQPADGKEISTEKVKSAVDNINKQIALKHTNCSFKYHEETNRISITVKDSETDEIIREIPPEKALDMLAKAWELAGLMVDEKR